MRRCHPRRLGNCRVVVIGLLALMCAPLLALPAAATVRPGAKAESIQRPEQPDASRRGNSQSNAELDHQVADAMQQLMVARLAKHLALSEAQQTTVIPMIREVTRVRREHAARRRHALRALATMSRDPETADDMLRTRLAEFQHDEQVFRREEDDALDAIRSHLDVRQQARLLAFEERFRDEMRRRVEDARRREGDRRGGGRMRPRHPAADRRPGGPAPDSRFR